MAYDDAASSIDDDSDASFGAAAEDVWAEAREDFVAAHADLVFQSSGFGRKTAEEKEAKAAGKEAKRAKKIAKEKKKHAAAKKKADKAAKRIAKLSK